MSGQDNSSLYTLNPLDHPGVFERLLTAARNGSLQAEGHLLDAFRRDLLVTAQAKLDSGMRPKSAVSDIVQESLLEAHRDFNTFQGESEGEVRAWLKRILLHNLLNHCRRWSAQRRDIKREVSLDAGEGQSSQPVADSTLTASRILSRKEQSERLNNALSRMRPDYRKVLKLRHREGLPFEEVGVQMGRSTDAVRMLWYRALDVLGRELERDDLSTGPNGAGNTPRPSAAG